MSCEKGASGGRWEAASGAEWRWRAAGGQGEYGVSAGAERLGAGARQRRIVLGSSAVVGCPCARCDVGAGGDRLAHIKQRENSWRGVSAIPRLSWACWG
ncbi:MAG: hypothetical protein ACPIOQ_54185 [Promethearchaeia archaeon]